MGNTKIERMGRGKGERRPVFTEFDCPYNMDGTSAGKSE